MKTCTGTADPFTLSSRPAVADQDGTAAHTIVTAQEASLEDLNRLIARSKAYWDWPEEYLSRAIPLHRITPSYLRSNRCFELVTKHGELLGFLSITEGNGRVVIDNLWIEPEHIGRGLGSRAVHFAFELGTCMWMAAPVGSPRSAG